MKNRAKKMLAGLLSAAMVFGTVPSEVFADSGTFIIGSRVVPGQDEAVENTEAVGSIDGVLPAEINAEGNLTILGGTYRLDVTTAVGAIGLDAQGIAVEAQDGAPDTSALNNDLTGRLFYAPYAEGGYALDARTQVTSFAFEKAEGTDTYALQVYAGEEKLNPAEGTLLLIVSNMNTLQADAEQTEPATEETGTEVTEPGTETAEVTEPGTEAAGTEVQPEVAEPGTEAAGTEVQPEVTEPGTETTEPEIQTEAAEPETEALTEAATEEVTEAAETEVQTEAVESETEAQTEAVTEAAEPETEALTEAATEAVTEAAETETEAQTAAVEIEVTETEPITEAAEPETEAPTEAATEAVTEAAEPETQVQTEAEVIEPETEAPETEIMTETEIQTEAVTEAESEMEEVIDGTDGISEAVVFEAPTEDGKIVKLSAPEGAFPVPASEVTMTAEPLTEEQKAVLEEQLAAMAEADGMKVTEYVAYDINLWVNGEIIQPLLPVQVTFENVAVAQESEDVPEDMSAVETSGFQMDTDTNEITSVNDTTVADDATPEDATVAVEVEHFTITGSFFTQVDPTNPNNYVFSLEQTDDGTQEDGETEEDEASSGEFVTFEVNVESLKGIGEGELTLVPSVVDGTEEDGEAEGTPVEVPFQADGEEISEVANPTALNANQNWKQRIQIPVSELEGVANPMLNLSLMNGGNNIATINSEIATIAARSGNITLNSQTTDKFIEISGDSTVKVNSNYNGAIEVKSGTVTIQGNGTIDAKSQNRSAIHIKGGTVTLKGNVTIKNGIGTQITNTGLEPRGNGKFRVGGGVYVEGGKFILEGGTICDNTAQRGGGIFVNKGATFNMSGGTVSKNKTVGDGSNTFASEGGGIYVWGTATISHGSIIDNTCNSKNDLGGGGLYINNGGIATLINAKITGNTAAGFGGGIAGCCHGEMSLVAVDGVGLYGNTAKGTSHTMPRYPDDTESVNTAEVIDGYNAATRAGINGEKANDFYTAGSCIVSNYMAGGGSANYKVRSGKDKKDITINDDQVLKYEGTVVALVANPTQESKDKVPTDGVLISGNTSTVHGGGIGCNGGLYFGSSANTEIEIALLNIEIPAKKQLNGGKPAEKQFTFELFDEEWNRISTAKNDRNGDVNFTLNGYARDKIADFDPSNPTYIFYLQEQNLSDNEMVYDKSLYKIEVTLKRNLTKTETVQLKHTTGSNKTFNEITVKYTQYTYTVESKTIKKIKDENGNDIDSSYQETVTDITFNNKTIGDAILTKKGAEIAFNSESGDFTITNGAKNLPGAKFDLYAEAGTIKESWNGTTYLERTRIRSGLTVEPDGKLTISGLYPGMYSVQETEAPVGYVLDPEPIYFETVAKETVYIGEHDVVTNKHQNLSIKVVKVDGATEEPLANAKFALYVKSFAESVSGVEDYVGQKQPLKEVNSDKDGIVNFGDLPLGVYVVKELQAPVGYSLTDDSTREVNLTAVARETDNRGANKDIVFEYTAENNEIKLYITKTDITGAEEIPGATLQVRAKKPFEYLDSDGTKRTYDKTISWESSDTEKKLEIGKDLVAGHTYVLSETIAPAGYSYAADIEFTVNSDGTVTVDDSVYKDNTLFIKDRLTEVKIKKIFEPTEPNKYKLGSSRSGKYAVFELRDKDGKLVNAEEGKDYPSYAVKGGTTPIRVGRIILDEDTLLDDEGCFTIYGLVDGASYTLTEVEAPEGFDFEANGGTKVTIMVDNSLNKHGEFTAKTFDLINTADEIKVNKYGVDTDADDQKMLVAGADLEIHVGSKEGAIATTEYGEVLKWTTTADSLTKVIRGLREGTYVLVETKAPDGYTRANPVTFTVKRGDDGKLYAQNAGGTETLAGNTVEMFDTLQKMRFAKVDSVNNKAYVSGAELEVHVATLKADATEGSTNPEDYEVGVVATYAAPKTVKREPISEQVIFTSKETPVEIEGLGEGNYFLVETASPAGYTVAEPVFFTVTQADVDDALVTVTMKDALTERKFSKDSTDTKKDHLDAVTLAVVEAEKDSEGNYVPSNKVVVLDNEHYKEPTSLVFGAQMNNPDAVYTAYGMKPGHYFLIEASKPLGYVKAQPKYFEVEENEKEVETTGKKAITITAVNHKTRVQIAKAIEPSQSGEKYILKDGDRFVFGLTPVNIKDEMNPSITVEDRMTEVLGAEHQIVIEANEGEFKQNTEGAYLSEVIEGLPAGTYKLFEVEVPDGYELLRKETDDEVPVEILFEVEYTEGTPVVQVIDVDNTTTKVAFQKIESETDEPLAGAHLQVLYDEGENTGDVATTIFYEDDENTPDEKLDWTTSAEEGETVKVFTGLRKGSYRLHEVSAPSGRVIADDIPFTVDETGRIQASGAEVYQMPVEGTEETVDVMMITMLDDRTEAQVTKKFENDYRLKEDEKVVFEIRSRGSSSAARTVEITAEHWDEEAQAYLSDVVYGLPAGWYVLAETEVPEGFTVAPEQEFEVRNLRQDGRVVRAMPAVDNEAVHKDFSKVDEDGNALAGATLRVVLADEDGEIVTDEAGEPVVAETTYGEKLEWPTGTEPKDLTGLAAGKYVLQETGAPEGYAYAEDIPFEIPEGVLAGTVLDPVVMTDMQLHFTLNKTDVTDATVELDGAELTVYEVVTDEETGEEKLVKVDSWTSKKGEVHDFGSLLKAGSSYVLREEAAPAGYGFVSDTKFQIEKDGTVVTDLTRTKDEAGNDIFLVEDTAINFTVNKTDVADATTELDGATLTVYEVVKDEETGEETLVKVDSWTSKKGEVHDFGSLLKAGSSYVLREEAAPQGYGFVSDTKFQIEKDGKVVTDLTRTKDEAGNEIFLVEDAAVDFTVNKVDVNSSEELDGAVLTVYEKQADGSLKEVESWTSKKGETHNFGGRLWAGRDYVLRETLAPTGYDYVSDIEFHIEKDGSVTTGLAHTQDESGKTVFLVNDRPLHLRVNKVDISNATTELAGAELTLYRVREDGSLEEVDKWVSRVGEIHDFGSKIEAGASYVLRETVAPDGYKYTADITFNIAKDGTVTTTANIARDAAGNAVYLVEDGATRGSFSKVDAETGEQLAGAKLQITDAAGTVIEQWTTDGTAHIVTAKLAVGKTYTLTETEAPEFYETAQPITFTVAQDGTIPDVVMRDMRISSEGASIAVTKALVYGGEAVNAVDETFYVALYEDEARTKLASDVKAIEFKNASSSTVRFTGLELGKPYYVGEADAQGTLVTSGVLADGTTYAANFNQGYRAEITQENGTVEVRFENELYTIPQNEFYKEGSLTITKRMLGADGRAMADNGTFYAGIFADAAHTTLSDRVSQNIVTLNLAGQSSVTQEVQVSMEPGEALTLYVAEVDASGVPVENDETFLYDVTVEGAEVTLTDSQNTAAAIITNQPVVPEDYYNEGELTITKMLLNAAGVETASNKVFYAGIFADPEYTTLSDRVSSNIVELALNGHSRATDSVKVSMEPGETVTLYVTEVSADGIPVDRSTSFRYDVTVEGAEVTMTNDTVGVTTITNQELEEEEEEETSFEEERSTEEGGSSDETIPAGTKAVKTGDETPIGLYLGLLLAAALVLILAFALRRRTRKQ